MKLKGVCRQMVDRDKGTSESWGVKLVIVSNHNINLSFPTLFNNTIYTNLMMYGTVRILFGSGYLLNHRNIEQ